jgi:hypothetical protein
MMLICKMLFISHTETYQMNVSYNKKVRIKKTRKVLLRLKIGFLKSFPLYIMPLLYLIMLLLSYVLLNIRTLSWMNAQRMIFQRDFCTEEGKRELLIQAEW